MKRTRIKPISSKRSNERSQYRKQVKYYLEAHPYDQIWIAIRGLDESAVIDAGGWYCDKDSINKRVPRSNQIHHRNKGRGERLLDVRWWMATSNFSHEQVEFNKSWAREEGYLLPIQADADGKWGSGNQALTTPELLKSKIK